MAEIKVRGYAKNSREATTINLTDWMGIQQGSSLQDMKKVSFETILQATKDYYTHDQISASSHWTIYHELEKYPSVTVIDSGGTVIIGSITYNSKNELEIDFSASFAGQAFLN